MHLHAQHEHHLHRQRRGGNEHAAPLALRIYEDAESERGDHQRHAQRAVGHGTKDDGIPRNPVAAQQEQKIAGGERRVVIARQRFGIFFDQPESACLVHGERQGNRQRHGKACGDAVNHAAYILLFAHVFDQRRHAQRSEQTRLRLSQHGQRKDRDGDVPLSLPGKEQHDDQQRREHRVNLPPAAACDDKRGACRHERRHAQRRFFAQLLRRRAVEERRQQEVTADRHKLQEHLHLHGAVRKAERIRNQPKAAQHQHVRRRIVAEIALFVKVHRAAGGHLPRPRREAAHVHAVPLHVQREDKAHSKAQQQYAAKRQRTARLFLRPWLRAQAGMDDPRRQQQIDRRSASEQRNGIFRKVRRFDLVLLFFLLGFRRSEV